MQKTNQVEDITLLPVPTEVLEELELDAFSTIQYSISRGRLIIEPIDGEQSMVCFGNCCRCPGRECCEEASLAEFLDNLSSKEKYAALTYLSVHWAQEHDKNMGREWE